MPKIGIIVNPNAGENRRKRNIKDILTAVAGKFGIVRVTRTIRDLSEVAKEFYQEKIDALGISGGDGTIQKTLTYFSKIFGEKKLPAILPLKGGTMNTIAHALRIGGTGEGILKRTIYKFYHRHPIISREIDLLKVNQEYGTIFGMGAAHNFLDLYYEQGVGPINAAKLVSKAVLSSLINGETVKKIFQPIKVNIWLDGEKISLSQFTLLLVATVKEVGLGFTPTYRAEEEQGCFHMISANIGPLRVATKIPKVYLGWPLKDKIVWDKIGKNLLIKPALNQNGSGPEKLARYILDGELFQTESPLKISVPARIKIMRV